MDTTKERELEKKFWKALKSDRTRKLPRQADISKVERLAG